MDQICIVASAERLASYKLDRTPSYQSILYCITPYQAVGGRRFSLVIVIAPDLPQDERSRDWLINALYCRLVPGGKIFFAQELVL